jgi:hypothetical protein
MIGKMSDTILCIFREETFSGLPYYIGKPPYYAASHQPFTIVASLNTEGAAQCKAVLPFL